jgi:XRE family transcriptional regulator of biofilm formation
MKKLFGKMIRQARKSRGLTLDVVATRTGLSKGYLSGIENGKVNPPRHLHLARLARQLELPEKDLGLFAFATKAPKTVQETPEFAEFRKSTLAPFRLSGLLRDEN